MTTPDSTVAPILDRGGNLAIVHMPGRKFPALVLQGDTLHYLISDLDRLRDQIAGQLTDEQREELDMVRDTLHEFILYYIQILTRRGLELPFAGPTPPGRL